LPGVRQFKIVQESLTHTRILLVTDAVFDESNIVKIEVGIRQRLGDAVRVEIERVAEVAKEKSGKYRYVVSHVASGDSSRRNAA
jgi:phenylacetate-CoA ligase